MPSLDLTLTSEGRTQELSTRSKRLIVGNGAGSNLRLPLPWIAGQQLEFRNESGFLRVRSLAKGVRAFAGRQELDGEWVVLPPVAEVSLVGPSGQKLQIELIVGETSGGAILEHNEGDTDSFSPVYAGAVVLGPDGQVMQEEEPQLPPELQVVEPRPAGDPRKLRYAIIATALVMAIIPFGLLGYNAFAKSREQGRVIGQLKSYQGLVDTVRQQIRDGKYVDAKASLDDAQAIAKAEKWGDEQAEVRNLYTKPEIQYGANGYERLAGKWVESAVAAAWREAQRQYDPRISTSLKDAESQLKATQYTDARTSCAEAMALMDKFPVPAKPHPLLDQAKNMDKDAANAMVAKDMLAKGMVLYQSRWMTPDERFRAQQAEKGLAEFKGKWLAKEELFAAQQQDKGLVLYNGKWMTPDEQRVAEGYVFYTGKWMLPAEKQNILDQIERDRLAQVKEESRRKQEALRLAELQRQQLQELEQNKRTAYDMSQVFLKQTLKHPLSAQFRPYVDRDVNVILKDGWYLVKAPVQAENGIGTLVGRFYVSKLRPTGGRQWETEGTTLLDE